jgi:hypothetical protein
MASRPIVTHDVNDGERTSVIVAWALQHLDIVGAILTDPPPSLRKEFKREFGK